MSKNDLLFKAIFESCPEGVFLIDADGIIQVFNRAMEAMTGWKREEVVGSQQCLRLFRCRHIDAGPVCRSDCPGQRALAHPGKSVHTELLLRKKTGEEIVVSASYRFLSVDSNKPPFHRGYAIGVMKEITEKKQAEREIKIQAITDELTGLFNFRHFHQKLDLEIKRAKRYQHSLSIIMLDIDHFKYYNDLHGHPQGNEVLKQMARLIRENTRETNIVARYGGEELIVLLPETEKEVAVQAAERLCSIIEGAVFPFEAEQPDGNLTVSVGVASYPVDAEEGEALVRIVDDILYQAKREGRNRVRWKELSH